MTPKPDRQQIDHEASDGRRVLALGHQALGHLHDRLHHEEKGQDQQRDGRRSQDLPNDVTVGDSKHQLGALAFAHVRTYLSKPTSTAILECGHSFPRTRTPSPSAGSRAVSSRSPRSANAFDSEGSEPTKSGQPIDRLQEARALDDRRTAGAYARTAVSIKLRGRARVLRDIEALGIDREDACAAIGEAFSEVDEATVLERALARRLHGPVQNLAHFRRLHQYLVRQGFPPGLAVAVLRARSVF